MRATRGITMLAALLAVMTARGELTDTRQGVRVPTLRSLQVYPTARPLEAPVLHTSSPETLTITFDELADDRRYLRYELVHCDADWRPSGLLDSEMVDGFNEGRIEDAEHSRATISQYVNYQLTLPNEEVAPKLSGNWAVRIYDEDMPDETLAVARFMVTEDGTTISGDVTGRTDYDYNGGHQQLELTVDTRDLPVRDLYSDLRLRIAQNNAPTAVHSLSRPLRVSGSKAVFEHDPALTFAAGNEYRRFETVSTNYPGMHVERVEYVEPAYHFELYTDEPRAGRPYEYDSTQQGRYVVNSDESDPATESEYVWVHFALDMAEQPGADVYIEGDLTGRALDESSRMTYDRQAGRYVKDLLLKQGSYNYRYLLLPHTAGATPLTGPIEGDNYRTVNEYGVAVYYREPGGRYDRLVGFATLYSGR